MLSVNDSVKTFVLLSGIASENGEQCQITMTDISERKLQNEELEETARLITLINTPGDFHSCLAALTASLQGWSTCEAVGIRLKSGPDFPYFETLGFPARFVEAEKYLCSRSKDGNIIPDDTGNPVLECMCGNILSGRFNPDKPFFTPHGSFWTNNTTDLLATTTETDLQGPVRNRCNREGYESVALIPLMYGKDILGLLQFNDHKPNHFTKILISHLEKMADTLAIALSRRHAEEALQRSEALLKATQKLTRVGGWEFDIEKQTLFWTEELYNIYDIEPGNIKPGSTDHISRGADCYLPDDRPLILNAFNLCAEKGIPYDLEFPFISEKGRPLWIRTFTEPVFENGKVVRVTGFVMDITESKKVLQALKESEYKYRALIENSPDAIAIYQDRKVVFVNGECLKLMSAKKRDDLIGRSLIEFVHPDCREFVIERMKKTAKDGTVLPLAEEKFIRLDGSEIDVEVKAMSIVFEGNLAVQLIIRDITERKRIETKLVESEERYKRITEGLTDYSYTVYVKNGKTLKTVHNDACKIITGYSPREFEKDQYLWINMVYPEERESVAARFMDVLKGKDLPQLEHRIICKNGKLKWINTSIIPKYDHKGRLISYDGVIKDITEQKYTELAINARLRLSEFALTHSRDEFQQELLNELEILTESKIGFFHSVDPDQKRLLLQTWSSNTLEKMCKAEAKGLHYDIEQAGVWAQCFYQRKAVIHNDYMSLPDKKGMPEGHAPVVRELAVPVLRNNNVVAIAGVGNKSTDYTRRDSEVVSLLTDMAWDIIERKQAEENVILKNDELNIANAEKDKFFSIIAHDLRSPFNAFLGLTQIMAEELNTLSIKEVQNIAEKMKNSASNLFQLLENLLEWSRFQRGVTTYNPVTFPIHSQVEEKLQMVMESADKKNIRLYFTIHPDIQVHADKNMFGSIIRNLVFNAVKFTPPGGKIRISADKLENEFICISVEDTGIGMNQTILENLFELNEISKRSGTEDEPSTGLGLIICKEFIEKHNGKIWAESVADKGTTFKFILPAGPVG